MKTKIKLIKTSRKGFQVPWTKMFLSKKTALQVEQEVNEIFSNL